MNGRSRRTSFRIAAALVVLAVGCGLPAHGALRQQVNRRTCRDTPPPRRPTRPPFPGPSIEELASLVRSHRPAAPHVPLEHGIVALPVDWRTLPMTALLWKAGEVTGDPVLVSGTLVTPQRDAIVGRDARSGDERWRVPVAEGRYGDRSTVLGGCGRVVLLDAERVAGLDPATGAAIWEIPREPTPWPATSSIALASAPSCRLAVLMADGPMRLPDGLHTSRLHSIDVASGQVMASRTCSPGCGIAATQEGAVVATTTDERWLFHWETGEPTRLPAGILAPDVAIAIEGTVLVARDRASGSVRWRRAITPVAPRRRGVHRLARAGDDLVVLDGSALVRVSSATGEDVWRTAISAELAAAIGRSHGHAADRDRLVIGGRGVPRFLAELDLSTGAVRSLRISAIDPVSVAVEGDLVAVRSRGQTGAVDLSLEAPPLRERLTLEDDVARAIGELTSGRASGAGAPWAYPTGRGDALAWLRRLRPLTGVGAVTARIERAEVGTASALLAALEGTAQATPMAVAVLERTYGCAPTERLGWIREAAAAALEPGLARPRADELARETIAWLDEVRARRAAGAPPDEEAAAWRAVRASRDALVRTSASSAPLRSLEDAIRRRAPGPIARRCVPSEDDAARAAVLRYLYELEGPPPALVRALGARCVEVQTLDGALEIVTGAGSIGPRWFAVSQPVEVTGVGEDGDHAPLPWPSAPARAVTLTYGGDPLATRLFIVQRVDGMWRVVWTGR